MRDPDREFNFKITTQQQTLKQAIPVEYLTSTMSGDSSKIEELVASYELLAESGGRGLPSVEDKLNNDVLSGWLGLLVASSGGLLSPEQVEDIRRRCTVSFTTRKRKAASRSTSTGDESSGNDANSGQKEKRRSRATTSKKGQSIRRADEQNERDSESLSRGNEDDGELETEQQDESAKKDPAPIALSRDAKLAKAREYLAEMRGKRDDYLNQSGGDGYDTPYLLVRLPSLMEQTETTMEWFFEDGMSEPVDACIRMMIQDAIDLYDLGMKSAVSFLDSGDKAWLPITFSSLAALANDLEELYIPTVAESCTRQEVKSAVVYAKKSGLFDLPTNQSPKNLAKHFLTMDVATKNYLLVLVHCAAGCGMFNSLDIEELTTGKDPIVSRDVLTILNYDKGSTPEDTNDLLKSFRKGFDEESNTHSDKTKLMESFLRIRLEVHHLSDEHWEKMEWCGASGHTVHSRSRRYFNAQARKTNAMIALTMLVASTFIHEHTCSGVDYSDSQTGVDVLMYQNTIPFLFQCGGTKLLMLKTYDGTASDKYMESVYTGLGDLAAKAVTGSGKGSGTSTYFDDISVLFDLDNDDDEDHDELLAILGFDSGEDGHGDMEFDADAVLI